MNPETSSTPEGAITDRIWNAAPVSQQAFFKLLSLLEIEITPQVPTACVTLGTRSKLRINPEFVARHCQTDQRLVMLVLHELFHVLLGHTRLYERVTPVQNWAFDAVINATLSRILPQPEYTALFRDFYDNARFPDCFLRPPDNWKLGAAPAIPRALRTKKHRALAGLYQTLYSEHGCSYSELRKALSETQTPQDGGEEPLLLG